MSKLNVKLFTSYTVVIHSPFIVSRETLPDWALDIVGFFLELEYIVLAASFVYDVANIF